MNELNENKDFFSIGSSASGVQIKVYLDDIYSGESVRKIDTAIKLWKNASFASGRIK
jgi:hypothetical protein